MPHLTNPVKGLLRFTCMLLAVFLIFMMVSFDFQRKNTARQSDWTEKNPGISGIPHFKMSKSIIEKYGGSWDRRIILKLTIKNISSQNPKVDLYSYLATSQDDHAEGKAADLLEPLNFYLPLNNYPEVIIGNNYIKLREIHKLINSLPGKSYDHIRFIPMISKEHPGHLVFGIKAYISADTPVNPYGDKTTLAYDGVTNPSPPAPPS